MCDGTITVKSSASSKAGNELPNGIVWSVANANYNGRTNPQNRDRIATIANKP